MRARDFAGPAYRFLRTEAGALGKLALPAIGVILAGNLLLSLIGAVFNLAMAVATFVSLLVLLQFARALLPELEADRLPASSNISHFDGVTWSLLWRLAMAGVLAWLPAIVSVMIAGYVIFSIAYGWRIPRDQEYGLLAIVGLVIVPPGLVVSLWLTARWALIPVLTAVPALNIAPRAGPFGSSWALTRGNAWLTFKVLVLTMAPFILIGVVVPFSDRTSYVKGILAIVQGLFVALLQLSLIAVSGHALVALTRRLRFTMQAHPIVTVTRADA